MTITFRIVLFLGLLLGFAIDSVMAETMYAKKDSVKVTVKKSPTSQVVSTLALGEEVEVLKKEKRQYYVKLENGKTGWVFKFKLSGTKPKSGRGSSALSGLTGKNVVVAKEARAGGSIRGLKESTEEYAKRKQISPAHQQAVDKMEQFQVSPNDLLQFQKEGGVGEFSGGEQ